MKLRKSFDFDFFTPRPFNENALYQSLRELFPDETESITLNKGTCIVSVKGIHISFFEYPYPLINPTISAAPVKNLRLASIEDIAVMKMSAIGGRGAKRDFFDLYYIFTRRGMTPEKLLTDLKKKFGEHFNFSYMIMGLDYFDDAETQILPETFVDFDWNKAKKFFVQLKKDMINCAFSEMRQ